jgi:hypothetical protein
MAREIVRAKIEAELSFTVKEVGARRRAAEEWKAKLEAAGTVSEATIVESRAAAAYWRRGFARAKERQSAAIMDEVRSARQRECVSWPATRCAGFARRRIFAPCR